MNNETHNTEPAEQPADERARECVACITPRVCARDQRCFHPNSPRAALPPLPAPEHARDPVTGGWLSALSNAFHSAKRAGQAHTAERLREILLHLAAPKPVLSGEPVQSKADARGCHNCKHTALSGRAYPCLACGTTTAWSHWESPTVAAPGREAIDALLRAQEWIGSAPHGDNCFLHDDGGEYDACFCGKDGVESAINQALENIGEPREAARPDGNELSSAVAPKVEPAAAAQAQGLAWAVARWNAEVLNRPLVNVHRRSLDDTWRQVIRYFGGNSDELVGPSHDALLAASTPPAPGEAQ